MQKEVEGLQKEIAMKTLSLESIVQADDHDLFRHYTGIDDYVTFNILYENLFAKIADKILYNERGPTEHRHGDPVSCQRKMNFSWCFVASDDETDLANRFGISCS